MSRTRELIKAHRSIRQFTDQVVEDELIEELVACGQSAATSNNVQAVTVIQVKDSNKRKIIADCAGGQTYVENAGAFLIYCADMNRPAYACQRSGGHYAAGMTEQFIIATVDVALSAQTTVLAAESAGLGICYIGGIRNDPARVAECLELPHHVYPVFGLCLGYPDQNPEVKPRMPLGAVLMRDRYDSSTFDACIDDYDETVSHYYANRSGGTKLSSWSEEMKALVGKESRPHMLSFLREQGFLQK